METVFDHSPSAVVELVPSIAVTPIVDAEDPTASPILVVSFFNADGSFVGARLSPEEADDLRAKLDAVLLALDPPGA